MTRSVGIDAGDYSVKVVEIDGSYRKTRLLRHRIERVSGAPEGDERAAATAAAIAAALKAGKISGDMVLGHPCREAVLRTIDVPFSGRDAIRKVIKAEVEGAIQSQAIDEMVVDFHEVGKSSGDGVGARVMVAAVPKQGLRAVLDGLRDAGLEPEHVDMDTMALYRVADWCGAFAPADAPLPAVAGEEAPQPTAIVLDLGARSTRVLVVRDGKLADMRTIRLGDSCIAEAVARAHTLTIDDARAAVQACLTTGDDWRSEVTDALPVAGEAGEPPAAAVPAAARAVQVTHAQVVEEQRAFLQRLSRELVRFLASQGQYGGAQALWITGGSSRLPGMEEMLGEVFGVKAQHLDVLGNLQHSLSPEEAETLGPRLATAIGLALAPLGGPEGFDLRQEDLAYTRGFDRVKFPLAIACMVALFTAIVYAVKLNNDLNILHYRIGKEYVQANQDPKFWGELNAVLGSWFNDARNFALREAGKDYKAKDLLRDLANAPVADRVKLLRDKLAKMRSLRQEESHIYEDISLESGLAVLVRFFEVLKRAEPDLGKYMLFKFDLNMKATGTGEKSGRFLKFAIAIRGDGFRERMGALRSALEDECKQPDSPFLKYDDKSQRESLFADSTETGVTGYYVDATMIVKESFAPFGGARQ